MLTQTYEPSLIQVEVITVITAGIIQLTLDPSFITFKGDLEKVWRVALDPYKFPPLTQLKLKYFLTLFIVIRTFTIHTTIATYIVLLWPAVFADRPKLMVPWLLVSTLRLCVDFTSTFVGLYICSVYGFMNSLWIEFLITQMIEHGLSFYIWLTIIRYRSHLIELRELRKKILDEEMYRIKSKRKSRHFVLPKQKPLSRNLKRERSSISESTIGTVIDRISQKTSNLTTRSLDTLLEIIEKHKENNQFIQILLTDNLMKSDED